MGRYHKIPEYYYPAKEPFQKDRYGWGYSYEDEREKHLSNEIKQTVQTPPEHVWEDTKWIMQSSKKNVLMHDVRQNFMKTKKPTVKNRTLKDPHERPPQSSHAETKTEWEGEATETISKDPTAVQPDAMSEIVSLFQSVKTSDTFEEQEPYSRPFKKGSAKDICAKDFGNIGPRQKDPKSETTNNNVSNETTSCTQTEKMRQISHGKSSHKLMTLPMCVTHKEEAINMYFCPYYTEKRFRFTYADGSTTSVPFIPMTYEEIRHGEALEEYARKSGCIGECYRYLMSENKYERRAIWERMSMYLEKESEIYYQSDDDDEEIDETPMVMPDAQPIYPSAFSLSQKVHEMKEAHDDVVSKAVKCLDTIQKGVDRQTSVDKEFLEIGDLIQASKKMLEKGHKQTKDYGTRPDPTTRIGVKIAASMGDRVLDMDAMLDTGSPRSYYNERILKEKARDDSIYQDFLDLIKDQGSSEQGIALHWTFMSPDETGTDKAVQDRVPIKPFVKSKNDFAENFKWDVMIGAQTLSNFMISMRRSCTLDESQFIWYLTFQPSEHSIYGIVTMPEDRPKRPSRITKEDQTDLAFTRYGTPIQTKFIKCHTELDQRALENGRAVRQFQLDVARGYGPPPTTQELRTGTKYDEEQIPKIWPNPDRAPAKIPQEWRPDTEIMRIESFPMLEGLPPEAMTINSQSPYLQDIVREPYYEIKMGRPPDNSVLIQNPIPIKLHNKVRVEPNSVRYINCLLKMRNSVCQDPDIEMYLWIDPDWLAVFNRSRTTAKTSISSAKFHEAPPESNRFPWKATDKVCDLVLEMVNFHGAYRTFESFETLGSPMAHLHLVWTQPHARPPRRHEYITSTTPRGSEEDEDRQMTQDDDMYSTSSHQENDEKEENEEDVQTKKSTKREREETEDIPEAPLRTRRWKLLNPSPEEAKLEEPEDFKPVCVLVDGSSPREPSRYFQSLTKEELQTKRDAERRVRETLVPESARHKDDELDDLCVRWNPPEKGYQPSEHACVSATLGKKAFLGYFNAPISDDYVEYIPGDEQNRERFPTAPTRQQVEDEANMPRHNAYPRSYKILGDYPLFANTNVKQSKVWGPNKGWKGADLEVERLQLLDRKHQAQLREGRRLQDVKRNMEQARAGEASSKTLHFVETESSSTKAESQHVDSKTKQQKGNDSDDNEATSKEDYKQDDSTDDDGERYNVFFTPTVKIRRASEPYGETTNHSEADEYLALIEGDDKYPVNESWNFCDQYKNPFEQEPGHGNYEDEEELPELLYRTELDSSDDEEDDEEMIMSTIMRTQGENEVPIICPNMFDSESEDEEDDTRDANLCVFGQDRNVTTWYQQPAEQSQELLEFQRQMSSINLHETKTCYSTPEMTQEDIKTVYTRETSVNTVYAQIFRTSVRKNPSLIAATERHPYISLPIGMDEENPPIVQGLLDTGAGLNIGYLPFWDSMAKKYPHLVKEFGPIDFSEYDKICVGGVNKDALATTCTHFIELYMPLRKNGRQVTLRIGLAQNFAANLILGIPFFVRARMIIYLAEGYVFSQAFQRTFPLQFLPPIRRETAPTQGEGVIAQTFIAGRRPPSK